MIQPSELRLGNLFKDKLTGAILSVSDLSTHNEDGEDKAGFYVIDRSKYPLPAGWQAEPIELTPELFQKIGAKLHGPYHPEGTTCEMQIGRIRFTWIDSHRYFYINGLLSGELKYLHEFQNLYILFDKKELTINL